MEETFLIKSEGGTLDAQVIENTLNDPQNYNSIFKVKVTKLPSPEILIPSEEDMECDLASPQIQTVYGVDHSYKSINAINWALSRLKELNPNINFKIK